MAVRIAVDQNEKRLLLSGDRTKHFKAHEEGAQNNIQMKAAPPNKIKFVRIPAGIL